MANPNRPASRISARRWAACLIVLAGLGSGGASAQTASDLGYAPNPSAMPAPHGYGAPAAPMVAAPGAPQAAGRRAGRVITRAEFIERRREAATRKGRDPEKAAKQAARMFDQADTNRDGVVDGTERAAFEAAHPELKRGGQRAAH